MVPGSGVYAMSFERINTGDVGPLVGTDRIPQSVVERTGESDTYCSTP